ncbi:MAG: hypothetical protein ABIK23_05660, partial [candidate division WOR-3 bacterium]
MRNSLLLLVMGLGVVFGQDSLNCRQIGSWPFGPAYAIALDTERNLVFLGSGYGVIVFDITRPDSLVKISEAIKTKGEVQGLFYQANRLYVAADKAGLEIWDVNNPVSPV